MTTIAGAATHRSPEAGQCACSPGSGFFGSFKSEKLEWLLLPIPIYQSQGSPVAPVAFTGAVPVPMDETCQLCQTVGHTPCTCSSLHTRYDVPNCDCVMISHSLGGHSFSKCH